MSDLPEATSLERAKGIEPSYSAWEADVLPLNYARKYALIISRVLEKVNGFFEKMDFVHFLYLFAPSYT